MVASTERKEQLICICFTEADIAMIDHAAGLRGQSRTDFVRDAAVCAAQEVLMERRLIHMSPEGFAEFMAILAEPAAPDPKLVEILKRPAPWEPGYVRKPEPCRSRSPKR